MTLNDLITNLFPLSQNKDWKDILQESSAAFTSESAKRLVGLLEGSLAIFENEAQHSLFLPILLSSGTPEVALTQLHDFAEAFRNIFSCNFNWSRPYTKALLYIFGRSNFLANRLKRNPELAAELLESPFLLRKKDLKVMENELRTRLDRMTEYSLLEFKNILRRYKYQEYLRITVRDLAQLCPFEETLKELSAIAICCLRAAISGISNHELGITNNSFSNSITDSFVTKNRESFQSSEEELQQLFPFMILGMGKLGGNELNYSSDIDLIFVHDNEPLTGDPERDYKLRMKAARILIEVMSEVTDEGFLARVDMRLRPGGDRAPLVQTLDEMEYYYTVSGELWERQSLIKQYQ